MGSKICAIGCRPQGGEERRGERERERERERACAHLPAQLRLVATAQKLELEGCPGPVPRGLPMGTEKERE